MPKQLKDFELNKFVFAIDKKQPDIIMMVPQPKKDKTSKEKKKKTI